MAIDLQLYLDTHPQDGAALDEYNKVLRSAEPFREQYERLYGPLYSFRSLNIDCWKWYKDPWPWQYGFNIDLPEECC